MNVLFCTLAYYPGVTGGAERQARLQAEELVRRGHRVTVVCARTDKLSSAEINGVRVVRLRRVERRPLFRLSYMVRLLAWMLRHCGDYDLVHIHLANLQADIAVAVAHRHHKPTYVKVACGGPVGEIQRFWPMARLTRWYGLRHADRVQALSTQIEAELASIGVYQRHVVRIPNGIDLDEFRPLSTDAKRRLCTDLVLPERDVIVLFLGRVVDYKGIDDLLTAWPRVRAENAHLVIVGATAEDWPTAPSGVSVRGWVESPLPYLQAADVFVHPSHADGMANAVLEAMACGCALVATEHGATSQFLNAGRNALLAPVRNSDALARALEMVVVDPDLRARLAADARESVHRYALSSIVDRIEAEYRTMLSSAATTTLDHRSNSRSATELGGVEEARVHG